MEFIYLFLQSDGCENSIETDQHGCLSEIVVAKPLRQEDFVPTLTSYHNHNINLPCGNQVKVQSTKFPSGRLVCREKDTADRIFVLACGNGANWTVVGGSVGTHQVLETILHRQK